MRMAIDKNTVSLNYYLLSFDSGVCYEKNLKKIGENVV